MLRLSLLAVIALAVSASSTRPAITARRTGVLAEKPAVDKALALRGGMDLTPETFCQAMTVVYGGFGVFLGTLSLQESPGGPVRTPWSLKVDFRFIFWHLPGCTALCPPPSRWEPAAIQQQQKQQQQQQQCHNQCTTFLKSKLCKL